MVVSHLIAVRANPRLLNFVFLISLMATLAVPPAGSRGFFEDFFSIC
jgi:hypothetical protein